MSEISELNLDQQKQLIKDLKQRMKDDGEYIYILGTRNQDYREALLNARNEVKQLKETIKELEEVNEYLRQKNDKKEAKP